MLNFCKRATEFVRDKDDADQQHNVDVFSLTLSLLHQCKNALDECFYFWLLGLTTVEKHFYVALKTLNLTGGVVISFYCVFLSEKGKLLGWIMVNQSA